MTRSLTTEFTADLSTDLPLRRLFGGALLLAALLISAANAAAGTPSRTQRAAAEAEQAALDEACQAAREEILAPQRAQFVEECVEGRSRRSREECERFYADHGNATAARGPLYMDLPECVKAHEFRQANSR